ncbi:hypothetical protein SAMN05660909_02571 [Chitinophaga terrae (ex Kim and Jung 2007)]|uniref:DUF4870 domain-containing protein n=1 Tax=Chitinophaga terrae (ex Kim and Jung 2007) TaxID=408074 RepID=A0A1H4CDE6_9BACT|nr:DUF4870 domain-containing protein [Chitinophaga terrae (ex Kim and Jung 2007)]MDQ0109413.1 putative Tic20 family protein [Chitinophaga terrae (ex Kim and Jung 2007)]GEP88915.1 hypothetical protein CTE07_05600 [Chitinophaga terrae (ex Kim and Jung 2007)]SEA58475.1 hypothetical protein SAMN05660909_02571 [Chitinophaga terrae (ex Kim and Jung 2007)]
MDQKDERTWGTLVHLAGIIGMWLQFTVGNVIAVLILWLIKRNESAWYDNQGKEAINFQITLSIVAVCLNIINNIRLGLFALGNFFWGGGSHFFVWQTGGGIFGLIWLVNIIFSIIAMVKASKGETYRYPLSLRLVK